MGFNLFIPNDIATYDGLQVPPRNPANITVALSQGGNSNVPNATEEANLDVSMVQAMAPNATILFFQENSGNMDNAMAAMATSTPTLTVASCSLNFGADSNEQQSLNQMAANGVSFFTASGDFGSSIGDPQDSRDMGNQTLVGGTILSTNALTGGTYPSPYYAGETGWPFSSGGIMTSVQIPGYQVGVSMASNGGSTSSRNFPDVAFLAQNIEIVFNGLTQSPSGTSFAAPMWAGFTALVNQNSQANGTGLPGFLNPTLYDIGLTSGLAIDLYKICFNDINDGTSNGSFNCVTGYDLVTGWGTPKAALINQLSTLTPLTPNQPLELVQITIGTGHDNLRGNGGFGSGCNGTGCTADILFPGFDLTTGVGVMTVTLKPTGTSESWNNFTTTSPMVFPISVDNAGNSIPLPTPSNGIAGIRINIQESFEAPCGPDNWDILTLSVNLVSTTPGLPQVCQLNLVGTSTLQDGHPGLVRLSNSPGGSGVGQTVTFLTSSGSGCP
jgi:hypothetical protein